MEDVYSGNSIPITITAKFKDGSEYIFKEGDKVIVGIKRYIGATDYIYRKEIYIEDAKKEINVNITPENTNDIEDQHIIEAKLICSNGIDVFTLFQRKFDVKGVVINE